MRLLSNSLVSLLVVMGSMPLPALAHKTEVSGDVAGIWHLEPNHSPKTGETSRVWVALTQKGGQPISLDQCDCQLVIYEGSTPDGTPVLEPTLEAISAESYQGIPGADVTFPEVGEYRLVLTGSPQEEATFTPFELSYTTVVAAGQAPVAEETATVPGDNTSSDLNAASPNENPVTDPDSAQPPVLSGLREGPLLIIAVGVFLASFIVAALRYRNQELDG
jgi:hypothetical protein